jgi:hypothetical protein
MPSRVEKVYRFYRDTPKPPARGHLYDHYKRGLAGIMEPSKTAKLAHAAWQAGRDKKTEEWDHANGRGVNV